MKKLSEGLLLASVLTLSASLAYLTSRFFLFLFPVRAVSSCSLSEPKASKSKKLNLPFPHYQAKLSLKDEQQLASSSGRITLQGVLTGAAKFAFVKCGSKTEVVSVGDSVCGYRLLSVSKDSAVFASSSGKLKLTLNWKKTEKSARRYKGSFVQGSRFSVRREEVEKEIASGNFLKDIGIVPAKDGLLVKYVRFGSLVFKLGIRPGDVIESINGIRIRTPEDSFSAFEQLKDADSVDIRLKRAGREITLHYLVR